MKTNISIRFLDFLVEPHPRCSYDYVEIYNGGNTASPLLGQYCGNMVPQPVMSSMNSMTVIFSTDGDGDFKGFNAQILASTGGLF